jgi:hypothetical protein
LGFGVKGCEVQGLGSRVWDVKFRIQDFGLRVKDLGFGV